jgi:hypothetical protein
MSIRRHGPSAFFTVGLSGAAMTLALVAASAATDVKPDSAYTNEKLMYIRRYAWPKRESHYPDEGLFVARRRGAAPATPVPAPPAATTGSTAPAASTPAAPSPTPAPPTESE